MRFYDFEITASENLQEIALHIQQGETQESYGRIWLSIEQVDSFVQSLIKERDKALLQMESASRDGMAAPGIASPDKDQAA